MPFLIAAETGLPLTDPMFWIVANRRSKHIQAKTLENDLRALMVLFLWGDLRDVDIGRRIADGQFLSQSEIFDLANTCGRRISDVLRLLDAKVNNVVILADRKKSKGPKVPGLGPRRFRLWTIRSYLEFVSAGQLSRLNKRPVDAQRYRDAREDTLATLRNCIGELPDPRYDPDRGRQALPEHTIMRLMKITDPDDPENPFLPRVRFRNFLMIKLLLETGMRRGELLGRYTEDFLLSSDSGLVSVERRPDDVNDRVRDDQPSSKTAARDVPISPRLAELVHEWLLHHRSQIGDAWKHQFFIVSIPSGRPMSSSNFNKIFTALRKRIPDLPNELVPHVLRHSWNDTFSKMIDQNAIKPEHEMQWRMRLMGWRSPRSAETYLKREVRRKSNAFLREVQDEMNITTRGDDQ